MPVLGSATVFDVRFGGGACMGGVAMQIDLIGAFLDGGVKWNRQFPLGLASVWWWGDERY